MVPPGTSLIAQSLTMSAHCRQSERQNIIDRRHTWQQCSVTISEDILTTKCGFNLRYISPLSINNELEYSITTRIFWLETSVPRMRQLVRTVTKLAHFWSDTRNTQWHEIKGAGGNSRNATSANFSARRTQSGGIPARPLMTFAWCLRVLKIAPGFPMHAGY